MRPVPHRTGDRWRLVEFEVMTTTDKGRGEPGAVARQWSEALRRGGYEPPKLRGLAAYRLRFYSRIWRRLHRLLGTHADTTFFEFGCGGGVQLIPLAFHGHRVAGIDVSREVLDRCRDYIGEVERRTGRRLPVVLYEGDFLAFEHDRQYDVVFNFGVIEHFLDESERLSAIAKMFDLAKPGGFVVSVVPNGMHPMRQRMRAEGLGGYSVPEIDYTDESAAADMLHAGAMAPRVYPANLFAYLCLVGDPSRLLRLFKQAGYLAGQLLPPIATRWTFRNAGSLIVVARKPGT